MRRFRGLLRNGRSGRKRPPLEPGSAAELSFRLLELGLRPERERRGAASHTAKGLRALWKPRKGAALDRSTLDTAPGHPRQRSGESQRRSAPARSGNGEVSPHTPQEGSAPS